ncbi:MAG: response regulator [Acidobacteriota bacterium]
MSTGELIPYVPEPVAPAGAAKKILVVDDSEIVRQLVADRLEDAGYSVVTLGSAFQLNVAIQKDRPDLILLDVRMPALRGDRAAEILRRHRFSRGIPIVLFSDTDEEELGELVATTGADGFVRKSPGFVDLPAALRRWI